MILNDNITIVIPFLRSNSDRFNNLKCVLDSLKDANIHTIVIEQIYHKHSIENFIKKFYPQVEYIKCNTDINLINKSMLVNIGVNHAKTKYVWQLDGDVILKWNDILKNIPDNINIIKPFKYIIKLNKDETTKYLEEKKIVIKKGQKRDAIKKFGPLSFIIKKEIYINSLGMDERFEGWGWEDVAFASKIEQTYQVFECEDSYGIHLYHIPAISNERLNKELLSCDDIHPTEANRIAKYNSLKYDDIGIIISYFSPCNFKVPKQNIYTIVKKLTDANYPVCVVEAVMPGADKLSFTSQVIHKQITANFENILFQKEALLNIGASISPYKKLVFLDCDIEFDNPDWFNKASEALEKYDIIQPYDVAIWLDKTNKYKTIVRISAAKAIADGLPIHGAKQHPGFAWAMTKDAFDKMNGFYYHHPLGGSDTIFWFSLIKQEPEAGLVSHWVITNEFFKNTKSYHDYRKHNQSFNFNIGYIENCSVLHLFHGQLRNRKYVARNFEYMPDMENGDFPVYKSENGLLAWKNIKDAENCLQYFQGRMEDG